MREEDGSLVELARDRRNVLLDQPEALRFKVFLLMLYASRFRNHDVATRQSPCEQDLRSSTIVLLG